MPSSRNGNGLGLGATVNGVVNTATGVVNGATVSSTHGDRTVNGLRFRPLRGSAHRPAPAQLRRTPGSPERQRQRRGNGSTAAAQPSAGANGALSITGSATAR